MSIRGYALPKIEKSEPEFIRILKDIETAWKWFADLERLRGLHVNPSNFAPSCIQKSGDFPSWRADLEIKTYNRDFKVRFTFKGDESSIWFLDRTYCWMWKPEIGESCPFEKYSDVCRDCPESIDSKKEDTSCAEIQKTFSDIEKKREQTFYFIDDEKSKLPGIKSKINHLKAETSLSNYFSRRKGIVSLENELMSIEYAIFIGEKKIKCYDKWTGFYNSILELRDPVKFAANITYKNYHDAFEYIKKLLEMINEFSGEKENVQDAISMIEKHFDVWAKEKEKI